MIDKDEKQEREENVQESGLTAEEKQGLNETETYENSRNDYRNEMKEGVEGIAGVPSTNEALNAGTGESHRELDTPGTHDDTPGSSGAFPVGAFDISKD